VFFEKSNGQEKRGRYSMFLKQRESLLIVVGVAIVKG
jgi:hypothetical protein